MKDTKGTLWQLSEQQEGWDVAAAIADDYDFVCVCVFLSLFCRCRCRHCYDLRSAGSQQPSHYHRTNARGDSVRQRPRRISSILLYTRI